ncbi:MAG: flippase [Rhodocyclaceae bacterium]|nr:MAG: flippase [Rhodocyclaceae bacterium]
MILQAFDVADLWFQSKVQSRYSVWAKNGAFLTLTIAKVWLILSEAELIAFAWVSTAEIALGALGLVIAFRSDGNRWLDLRPTWIVARSLLRESWPLFLSSLGAMLYMRVDQVMLAEMVGEREVGLYSAAVRLSEVWYLIPPVIVSSVMPFLTEARGRSEPVYYQRLQQLFMLLIRSSLLVAIPVSLCATPLMSLLFGSAYEASGSILAVHIWSVVFVFMGAGTTPWIINERLARLALYQTSLGAVLNIALNLWLIPLHGAIGAAIATACSLGISIWLANYFLSGGRRLFWLQTNAMLLGIRFKSSAR